MKKIKLLNREFTIGQVILMVLSEVFFIVSCLLLHYVYRNSGPFNLDILPPFFLAVTFSIIPISIFRNTEKIFEGFTD